MANEHNKIQQDTPLTDTQLLELNEVVALTSKWTPQQKVALCRTFWPEESDGSDLNQIVFYTGVSAGSVDE